jgi:hypothetical protein
MVSPIHLAVNIGNAANDRPACHALLHCMGPVLDSKQRGGRDLLATGGLCGSFHTMVELM